MSNINDLFETFPDYNVFDDSTNASPKVSKSTADKSKPKKSTKMNIQSRADDDYGDDFGIYRVEKRIQRNFTTIFYFPFLFLWLEIVLRFSCGETMLTINYVYIFLYTVSLSSLFMLLCSFFKSKVNRNICRVFSFIITALYSVQIIYFDIFGRFLTISENSYGEINFENISQSIINKWCYLLIAVIPLLLMIFAGKFIFPFRRVHIPAKLLLVLATVAFYFITLGATFVTDFINIDSEGKKLLNDTFNSVEI
ncbi:MAG: hypothetical protein ACI4Q8_04815, partial [Ruminococcus sp.]